MQLAIRAQLDGYQVNFRVPPDAATGAATIQVVAAWIAGTPVSVSVPVGRTTVMKYGFMFYTRLVMPAGAALLAPAESPKFGSLSRDRGADSEIAKDGTLSTIAGAMAALDTPAMKDRQPARNSVHGVLPSMEQATCTSPIRGTTTLEC